MNPMAEVAFALAFICISVAVIISVNLGSKCKCGGEIVFDGYHDVCNKCGRRL